MDIRVGGQDRELTDRLDAEIYAFNAQVTGLDDGELLTARVTDDSGGLVAGLSGWTWGGCGYVDVLWVHESSRGLGVGTALMDAAEAEARERGCSRMVLSTHTFQAPDFYRSRGYVETGRTEDYPEGYAQVHLTKRL
jgi:GNAT superfamily N-acetyltransferase